MSRRSDNETRRRSRKKKRGGFTTFLGVLLILVAAGLLLLDPLKNYLIKNRQKFYFFRTKKLNMAKNIIVLIVENLFLQTQNAVHNASN